MVFQPKALLWRSPGPLQGCFVKGKKCDTCTKSVDPRAAGHCPRRCTIMATVKDGPWRRDSEIIIGESDRVISPTGSERYLTRADLISPKPPLRECQSSQVFLDSPLAAPKRRSSFIIRQTVASTNSCFRCSRERNYRGHVRKHSTSVAISLAHGTAIVSLMHRQKLQATA